MIASKIRVSMNDLVYWWVLVLVMVDSSSRVLGVPWVVSAVLGPALGDQ